MLANYFTVAPQPEELFSSWVMNTASRTRDTAYATARRLLGSRNVWTRDIDRVVSPEELVLAGARARISALAAIQTGLWPLMVPADRGRQSGFSKGVLAIGVYHRERRLQGLQFCPHCLAGDRQPYFRRQWRLALWCVCVEHQIILHCACFNCDSPLALHRTNGAALCACPRCGVDQRLARVRAANAEDLGCMRDLQLLSPDRTVRMGTMNVDYQDWLGLLGDFWRLIPEKNFQAELDPRGSMKNGIGGTELIQNLELSSSDVRALWLPRLVRMIESGLPAIIAKCQSAGITQSLLRDYRRSRGSAVTEAICRHLAKEEGRRRPRLKKPSPRISNARALIEIGLDTAIQKNLDWS